MPSQAALGPVSAQPPPALGPPRCLPSPPPSVVTPGPVSGQKDRENVDDVLAGESHHNGKRALSDTLVRLCYSLKICSSLLLLRAFGSCFL